MLQDAIIKVGSWLGITDPQAITIASGAVLASIFIFAMYMVLTLLMAVVAAALSGR